MRAPWLIKGMTASRYLAADVIEIHINSLRATFLQGLSNVRGLVIDRRISSQFLAQVAILFVAAGDTHHTTAFDLRNLQHSHADSARGARDNDGLAFFRLANVEQAEVGGQPRHPQDPECRAHRKQTRIYLDAGHWLSPALKSRQPKHAADDISALPGRRARLHHLTDYTAR